MAYKIDFIRPVLCITYIEKADYLSYIILEIQSSLCCLEYSNAEVKKKQLSRKRLAFLYCSKTKDKKFKWQLEENAFYLQFLFTDYKALKNQYEKQAKTRKRLLTDLS